MNETIPYLPGLSPVAGKELCARFDGARLSSDGGVLLLRGIEKRLGLAARLAGCLADARDPASTTHSYADMIGARMFAITCGYEDCDDLDVLRFDPAFKLACGRLPETGRHLMSQPTLSRLENAPSWRELARMGLSMIDLFCESFDRVPQRIVLDIDDTDDAVHGGQQLALFTSAARAITRCSCSTSSAIWSVAPCVRATCTAPMNGAMCWTRWSLDTGTRHSGVISVVTPPSPRPRFMSFWKRKASSTPSGFRPTRCCTTASRTCSSAPSVGRRRKFVGITRTSAIGPVPSQTSRRDARACTRCGTHPPVEGGTVCETCHVARRDRERDQYATRRTAGLCGRCGTPAPSDAARCDRCARSAAKRSRKKAKNARSRQRYARRRARRLCSDCGAPSQGASRCPWVFPSPVNPERARTELDLWKRVRKQAGIEDVRIHDLRHTFASQAAMQGIPLPVVARLLGHAQVQMTLRYAHVSDRDVEAAAERIGGVMAGIMNRSPVRPEAKP